MERRTFRLLICGYWSSCLVLLIWVESHPKYGRHSIDNIINARKGNTVAQCFVPGRVGSVWEIRPVIREALEPFTLQRGQTADQVGAFDDALVLAHILVVDSLVIREAQGANGLLVRLHHQVGGILVLPCTFGADHIVLLKHIHPLTAEYRMAVGGCQGVYDTSSWQPMPLPPFSG